MADEQPRYRFRGSIKPTAEVKRPVKAYRNAATDSGNGSKATSATIDIFDVIDSWGGWWGISAAEVDSALADLGDVETLFVRVNSPGGEATEGIAIANLLRAHAATIHVTNYGLAASAASVIAIAGDTLSMAPGSMLMIHEAWNYARGNAADLRAEAAILDKFNESMAGLYALKGGSETDWRGLMAAETWFTPTDAVEAGLADKIGIDVAPPPANGGDQAEPMPDVDGDTPFDRAARIFDLSVFAKAPVAALARPSATAVPTHSTATSTSSWDGSAQEKNLTSPMTLATAKKVYAWYDGGKVDNGNITKASCKFPHHFVSADGTASTKACQSVIAILNGGMGGADIPAGDRQGVYDHVAKHLRDADLEPAPLTLKLPAEPPEKSPSTEEADSMSDTTLKALRERFGLGDDADEAAVLAKVDEARAAATTPPEITEDAALTALAEAAGVDTDKVKAAIDGAKAGKVTVSQTLLEELKANAKLGAEARAKQLEQERDDAVEAAFRAGKISAERRDTWRNAWDKDPEGTKADLDSLEARFPVGEARGYAGHDGSAGDGADMTDEEAEALAALSGTTKEALLS